MIYLAKVKRWIIVMQLDKKQIRLLYYVLDYVVKYFIPFI